MAFPLGEGFSVPLPYRSILGSKEWGLKQLQIDTLLARQQMQLSYCALKKMHEEMQSEARKQRFIIDEKRRIETLENRTPHFRSSAIPKLKRMHEEMQSEARKHRRPITNQKRRIDTPEGPVPISIRSNVPEAIKLDALNDNKPISKDYTDHGNDLQDEDTVREKIYDPVHEGEKMENEWQNKRKTVIENIKIFDKWMHKCWLADIGGLELEFEERHLKFLAWVGGVAGESMWNKFDCPGWHSYNEPDIIHCESPATCANSEDAHQREVGDPQSAPYSLSSPLAVPASESESTRD
ncbi:MAG: hypothetical protein M1827_002656 [Pycnora praestabilis]|nr:MAG: hypothetical protein M1827_002656 [Pycnora praestabilis]